MDKSVRWKLVLIVVVIAFCLLMALPLKEKINLGLDLKGGMHLVLKVKTDEAIGRFANDRIDELQREFTDLSVKYESVARPVKAGSSEKNPELVTNVIVVKGLGYTDKQKIDDFLDKQFANWNMNYKNNVLRLQLKKLY